MSVPQLLVLPDLDEGYLEALRLVLEHGEPSAPRGLPIRELLGATIHVKDTSGAMPFSSLGRRLVPAVGVAEALSLVAGRSYPELLARIAPSFRDFMDGGVLTGAYGPRIGWQLPALVERLRSDSDTRQARLIVADPRHDLIAPGRDVACTTSLTFMIRHDELHMFTNMRSQDVWLGLAYDAYMFAELQATIAHVLGVAPGSHTHSVDSLHLYDRNVARAEETLGGAVDTHRSRLTTGVRADTVAEAMDRADRMLRGQIPYGSTPHERWCIETLEPYL